MPWHTYKKGKRKNSSVSTKKYLFLELEDREPFKVHTKPFKVLSSFYQNSIGWLRVEPRFYFRTHRASKSHRFNLFKTKR